MIWLSWYQCILLSLQNWYYFWNQALFWLLQGFSPFSQQESLELSQARQEACHRLEPGGALRASEPPKNGQVVSCTLSGQTAKGCQIAAGVGWMTWSQRNDPSQGRAGWWSRDPSSFSYWSQEGQSAGGGCNFWTSWVRVFLARSRLRSKKLPFHQLAGRIQGPRRLFLCSLWYGLARLVGGGWWQGSDALISGMFDVVIAAWFFCWYLPDGLCCRKDVQQGRVGWSIWGSDPQQTIWTELDTVPLHWIPVSFQL